MHPAPNVFSPMGNVKQRINKWATGVAIVSLIFGLLQTIRMILLNYQFAKQEYIPDIERTAQSIGWIMLVVWILMIIFSILLATSLIRLSNLELRVSLQSKWAGILLIIASTLGIVNYFVFVETKIIIILFYFLPLIPLSISYVLIVLTFKKLKELKLCNAKLNSFLIIAISLELVSCIFETINYFVDYSSVVAGLTMGIVYLIFFVLFIGFLVGALIKLGKDALTIDEQPYLQSFVQPQPIQPILVQPQPVQYVGNEQNPNQQIIPIEKPQNPEDYRFCKQCGTKYHKSVKFCTNCGENV